MEEACKRLVLLLISQMNLLLCLVNDMLDLKMIEMGEFVSRREPFKVGKTFQFILDIFQLQSQEQHTRIKYQAEKAPINSFKSSSSSPVPN